MTYLEFLGRWYNLAFLLAGAGGLACAIWGRIRGYDLFRPAATLVVTAFVGLTCNGAIHDLGLGSPALRFPYVLAGSAAAGWLAGRSLWRFRSRHFRPISAVRFNRPGHDGVEARLVTRGAGSEPGSGRAQWQDREGTLHIVHVHTSGEDISFGCRVLLDRFDEASESYLVRVLSRRRRFHRFRGSVSGM
jgi:hypothetical protein